MSEQFPSYYISDSFTFANTVYALLNYTMFLFDVSSLFINVATNEMTEICLGVLYDESETQTLLFNDVFVELMKCVMYSVEFTLMA